MALKPLKCPSCGGQITNFDDTMNKGVCPYCDSIIENIQDLQSQFVKVKGIDSADDIFKRAKTFQKLEEDKKAYRCYLEYTDKYPQNFDGWYELSKFEWGTENRGYSRDPKWRPETQQKYVKKMCLSVSNEKDKEELLKLRDYWDEEKNKIEAFINTEAKPLNSKLEALNSSIKEKEKTKKELPDQIKYTKDTSSCFLRLIFAIGIALIVLGLLFIVTDSIARAVSPVPYLIMIIIGAIAIIPMLSLMICNNNIKNSNYIVNNRIEQNKDKLKQLYEEQYDIKKSLKEKDKNSWKIKQYEKLVSFIDDFNFEV